MTTATHTADQVVAFNLRRARELRNWTQDEAAERLEPYLGERWSRVVFSAAERSVSGGRVRQFSASQLVAIAATFELPIAFFLMPPVEVEAIAPSGAQKALTPEQLIELAITRQDDRVQELVEDRYRDLLQMAHPRATPDIRSDAAMRGLHGAEREAERAEAADLRAVQLALGDPAEAQRQAGIRALRAGNVVQGQQPPTSSKREGKP